MKEFISTARATLPVYSVQIGLTNAYNQHMFLFESTNKQKQRTKRTQTSAVADLDDFHHFTDTSSSKNTRLIKFFCVKISSVFPEMWTKLRKKFPISQCRGMLQEILYQDPHADDYQNLTVSSVYRDMSLI